MEEGTSLTRREWEVLELVAEGRSNHEVAELLCISVNTVEQHLKHIFGKLRVKNRTLSLYFFSFASDSDCRQYADAPEVVSKSAKMLRSAHPAICMRKKKGQ